MANLRTGSCGTYYGSIIGYSRALTQEQMNMNAKYIAIYLLAKGWTLKAISGMLGNMQAESSINPGRWQSDDVGNTSGGYGLVQWTPATKYLSWCNSEGLSDVSEMDNNLARIIYELENNIQWIATDTYNLTFKEFSTSNESVDYLASAFLKCYERAGVEVEETRRNNANTWYTYLSNLDLEEGGSSGSDDPGSTGQTRRKKKRFNFVIFGKNRSFRI